jgi:hypothetical protein
MMRSDPPEPIESNPGQIYLRETFNNQTYIRLFGNSERDDELSVEMLLLYLSFLNDKIRSGESDQSQIPSIDIIERSKDTYETWSRGAAYHKQIPRQNRTTHTFTHPEDKRAFEELRANPEKRDEIRQQWGRAVGRNKNRTITSGSLGSTWRRLVARAKENE